MAQIIFPFALALALVLTQPLIDAVCEDALRKNQFSNQAIQAARWTGATAAFLPSAVLTAYGALLVMWDEGHEDGDSILIGAVIVLLVCFALFLYALSHGGPAQSLRFGVKAFKYTFLQLTLAALNVGGILLAIWYHFHGTPSAVSPPS